MQFRSLDCVQIFSWSAIGFTKRLNNAILNGQTNWIGLAIGARHSERGLLSGFSLSRTSTSCSNWNNANLSFICLEVFSVGESQTICELLPNVVLQNRMHYNQTCRNTCATVSWNCDCIIYWCDWTNASQNVAFVHLRGKFSSPCSSAHYMLDLKPQCYLDLLVNDQKQIGNKKHSTIVADMETISYWVD